MNKKKILTLVLCGTIIFSATGVSTAAEGVSGFKTGKEKILTELSVRVRDNTQERERKMSSLVKAAVQIARSEEEARKAAEAAAAEEKAKQEAEEKARKEREESGEDEESAEER